MNLWIKRDTMLTIKREHGEFDIKKIPDGAIFKDKYKQISGLKVLPLLTIH